ncbi:hypothetical protein BKA70DRAFT_1554256, partial [Coprinopsis sp. MPI-PUGE-AT-0042]
MDIWYHIAASLDPPDILALRTTCSALLRMCRKRSIWLQAARTMCHGVGLFLPSFPLESMSVKELTRLALSPYIFSRLVSQEDTLRLPERQSRTFNPYLKSSEKGLVLKSLHMLPGGRYLITYQNDDVCLWDLGYGPVPPSQSPIACLHVKGIHGWYSENPPCPTADGKGVRLMILSDNSSGTSSMLGIYDIYPGSEHPEFRRTTSWQVPSGSVLSGSSSRYVVLCKDTVAHVYVVGNTTTDGPRSDLEGLYGWRDNNPNHQTGEVAILGDTFLLSTDSGDAALNLFSIPRTPAWDTTECPPHLVVPCPIPGEFAGTLYTSEWTASSGEAFFALGGEVSETIELQIYRMVDVASLSEPLLPSAILVKVGRISIPDWYRFIRGPNIQRMPSGLAVIGISEDAIAVAKIDVSLKAHDLPVPSIKRLVDLGEEDFPEEVSACVATGRLVVASRPNIDGRLEWVIRVTDYLSPG